MKQDFPAVSLCRAASEFLRSIHSETKAKAKAKFFFEVKKFFSLTIIGFIYFAFTFAFARCEHALIQHAIEV